MLIFFEEPIVFLENRFSSCRKDRLRRSIIDVVISLSSTSPKITRFSTLTSSPPLHDLDHLTVTETVRHDRFPIGMFEPSVKGILIFLRNSVHFQEGPFIIFQPVRNEKWHILELAVKLLYQRIGLVLMTRTDVKSRYNFCVWVYRCPDPSAVVREAVHPR